MQGIGEVDYDVAITVLKRIVANLET